MTKDIAVKEEYAIMDPTQDILEIIRLNLGGESLSIGDLDTIKMPSSGNTMWSIPTAGDDEVVKTFEGIIIYSQIQRTYWEKEYSGKGSPPDCFSNDAITGIGNPGGNCKDCPMDQFKTARTGGGKACATKRIMFILQQGNLMPSVIRIPVGGLPNSRNYLQRLSNKSQRMYGVYTEFGLEKATNKQGIEYSRITFKMKGALNDKEIKAVEAYSKAILPFIDRAVDVFVPDEK